LIARAMEKVGKEGVITVAVSDIAHSCELITQHSFGPQGIYNFKTFRMEILWITSWKW